MTFYKGKVSLDVAITASIIFNVESWIQRSHQDIDWQHQVPRLFLDISVVFVYIVIVTVTYYEIPSLFNVICGACQMAET